MTEIFQGPGSTSDDDVVTTVDEEIRQEALRQVESIDCDDDHWRIDPLPKSLLESSDQKNRHNN